LQGVELSFSVPFKYLNPLKQDFNKDCSPQYVIDLFMRGNAQRFLKNFHHGGAIGKKDLEKAGPCGKAGMKE